MARMKATPPPATYPSLAAARVALSASSTRSFRSFMAVSVGAPTLMIGDAPTRVFLAGLGKMLARPRAVLCVSAHWETADPMLTGAAQPKTIHDFYGFPPELYEMSYPAPGDPGLAREAATLLTDAGFEVEIDESRGLDHGAWVPSMLAYPQADVPVVQLSVQPALDPKHHLAIGSALRRLRERGVLILGSGGATHNLREFRGQPIDAKPPEYARAFDAWLEEAVTNDREQALIDFEKQAPNARRNHPTTEHFLPLFVPMGAKTAGVPGRKLHEAFTYGVLSMAAYAWD